MRIKSTPSHVIVIAMLITLFNVISVTVFAGALHDLLTRIRSVKQVLTHSKNQYQQLQDKLKKTEIEIGKLKIKRQRIEKKLAIQRHLLAQLQHKRQQYQRQLVSQRHHLAERLRTVYLLGHESYWKLLLNQQQPDQYSRMMTYYHYLMTDQVKQMTQLRQTLHQLQLTRQQIQSRTKALQQLKKHLIVSNDQLQRQESKRRQLLAHLSKQIKTNQEKLQNLLADKRKLQQVVVTVAGKKMALPASAPFAKLQGKLAWPTRGKVIVHFGDRIFNSQIHWQGILIKAKTGQKVHAVAPGRVVFANWMSGFGLLLIVQHDNGYMTIYGHNNSLYKQVGDTVKAGELIATVGTSGGHAVSALYFAIRHDGKALDPLHWFA